MTILKALGTTDTIIQLEGPSTFPGIGGVVLIDSENIAYTMSSDDQLINCTRGFNGTTAAVHAAGAVVTLLESVPTAPGTDPRPLPLIPYRIGSTFLEDDSVKYTDPSAITPAMIDGVTVLWIFAHAGNVTVTLPTPSVLLSRRLIIIFTTDASHTLSVNSVSVTAGTAQEYVYSAPAAAWFAVA